MYILNWIVFLQLQILKVKQSFYKKVLEEDQNYNKVHKPDKNNKYIRCVEASKTLTPGWKTVRCVS
jgi:hypothetical protein